MLALTVLSVSNLAVAHANAGDVLLVPMSTPAHKRLYVMFMPIITIYLSLWQKQSAFNFPPSPPPPIVVRCLTSA